MANICLHLGFHKTATSYLQTKLFNIHPDIEYWGKSWKINWKNNNIEDLLLDYIFFERNVELEKVNINKTIKLDQKKLNIFSEERLSSNFYYKNQDMRKGVKRISEVFDPIQNDIKLVVFLRNQSDVIISRYAENNNLFVNASSNWNTFKNFSRTIINKNLLSLSETNFLNNFNYYDYIKLLEKYFDYKKIGVFFYEDLINEPKNTLHRLFKFLEIDPIKISNKKFYATKKLFGFYESKNNKYYSSRKDMLFDHPVNYKNLPEILKKIIKIAYPFVLYYPNFFLQIMNNPIRKNRKYVNSIIEYYKNDNVKLARYLNTDIKKRGYYF